ncbi:MAG: trypsin-like peptidase domain-containing protein [Verrucomicrobiae bacterium]|nr:trypsin-like peptidase domain-containing protein [Verrucomicrobiae bacterium]
MIFALLANVGAAPAPAAEVDIRRNATVAAIERVTPSVVNIRTSKLVRRNTAEEEFYRRFFGWNLAGSGPAEEQINNIGSGVIVEATDDEGYILTNFHVLQQAERVQVQLWDGREYEAEKLLYQTQKDLALLKIVRRADDPPFRPILLAADDDLLLGETAIAIGNPFGLGGSVSQGILSSKNRRLDSGGNRLDYLDWLQTDADINPGNSGGPLVNIRGELIGINVAVYNQEEGKGTGFAIPVKQISSALSDFFSLEYSAKLWLGARFRGSPKPLEVRYVQPHSPADDAGLREGQQVIEVNGQAVSSLARFCQLMAASSDHQAQLVVLDQGVQRKISVQMVPLEEVNRALLGKRLGLTVGPISNVSVPSGNPPATPTGLTVTAVEKDGPAAKARLEAGMIVSAIDNVPVTDVVNLSNVLGNKRSGDPFRLIVNVATRYADGQARWLTGPVDIPAR